MLRLGSLKEECVFSTRLRYILFLFFYKGVLVAMLREKFFLPIMTPSYEDLLPEVLTRGATVFI